MKALLVNERRANDMIVKNINDITAEMHLDHSNLENLSINNLRKDY
jgi:hypothetical protein